MAISESITEGEMFGRLRASRSEILTNKNKKIECVCSCGEIKAVAYRHLLSGRVISCGCASAERTKKRLTKHGEAVLSRKTTEYRIWVGMKARCNNPKEPSFKWYGARGISVCDRWINSFDLFLADMGRRPPNTSIDRINNDGNYEPGNCRWADKFTQARNKRKRTVPAGG